VLFPREVVIVPGYGVAVSKAQYALAELVEMLSKTLALGDGGLMMSDVITIWLCQNSH
jgi:hypothetical protein